MYVHSSYRKWFFCTTRSDVAWRCIYKAQRFMRVGDRILGYLGVEDSACSMIPFSVFFCAIMSYLFRTYSLVTGHTSSFGSHLLVPQQWLRKKFQNPSQRSQNTNRVLVASKPHSNIVVQKPGHHHGKVFCKCVYKEMTGNSELDHHAFHSENILQLQKRD